MTELEKPLNIAGLHLQPDTERKFALIAAGLSIVGFILYVKSKTGSSSASSSPASVDSGGTGTTGTTDTTAQDSIIQQLEQDVTDLKNKSQTSVTFGYTVNTGDSLTNDEAFTSSSTSEKSGGGIFSGFGIKIGGGGGSQGSSTSSGVDNLTTSNNDSFTADTTLTGASQSEIDDVEAFLTQLTGTYEQRVAGSVVRQGQGYSYQNPGEQDPNLSGKTNLPTDSGGIGSPGDADKTSFGLS